MQKNIASQKWVVRAFYRHTALPITGDANNITALLSKDGNTAVALNDLNPVEIGGGFYAFDLTQEETNASFLILIASSTTAKVDVIGFPAAIWTEPASQKYAATLSSSDVSGNLPASVTDKTGFSLAVSPPTKEEIASQIRLEIATELGRIDATISSRLASSGYTAPANSDITEILNRLTSARAGYLDLLNEYLDFAISEIPTKEEIREEIDSNSTQLEQIITDISYIPTTGKGSKEVTYTLTKVDLTPIADANIKVTSDILGLYRIAEGRTNQSGQFSFQSDAESTVYIWRSKTGEVFINPDIEEVPE